MTRKCRFRDCPTPYLLADMDERVTCRTCREVMGLLPLPEDRREDDDDHEDGGLDRQADPKLSRQLRIVRALLERRSKSEVVVTTQPCGDCHGCGLGDQ